MTTESRLCPQCGAPLPSDAPQGACPRCVLEMGMASAASGPADSAALFPSGYVPPKPEEIASLFPQWEFLELLGRGGMGIVYKVRQPHLDRLAALKILPPSVGRDPSFAERFQREARALAKLTHPHIVNVYDFGETSGPGDVWYYLLMEYVDGVNLRQMVHSGGLQPREALAIVPQICDALQYAHDNGIVHRDIKPENLLVDKQGRVKIADFGLAKLINAPSADFRLTGTHQVIGTPLYMAPEQIEHTTAVDHRADIYSMGVVFYEMLTGELPLGRFAPPSQKVQIDVRLDDVVLRTLEKEPERRYQQVSQVRTAVETIARSPRPVSRSTTSDRRWFTWRGKPLARKKVVLTTAAIAVLIFVAFNAVYWSSIWNERRREAAELARAEKGAAPNIFVDASGSMQHDPRDMMDPRMRSAGLGAAAPEMMGEMSGSPFGAGSTPPDPFTAEGYSFGSSGGPGTPFIPPFVSDGDQLRASPGLIQSLQLTEQETSAFNKVLADAVEAYRKLEDEHTRASVVEDGSLAISLQIPTKAINQWDDRFWRDLDAILDHRDEQQREARQRTAREIIHAHWQSSGRDDRDRRHSTRVWRSGTWLRWKGGLYGEGHAPKLPPQLDRLWKKYSHLLEAADTAEWNDQPNAS